MQTVLNFPSLLQHTFIVGAYCSGKDLLAGYAIKNIKQQRPSLKVYVIDIKEHPRESHYYANADFLRIKKSSNVASQEEVKGLVSWIQDCFNEFESLEGEKLLVLSESTLVFHFFAKNKSNRTWLSNKVISYLCLGNASGIYIWLIGLVGAIGETIATSDRHVSPTTIGELYAERQGLNKPIKPHIVNRVLEEAGLQYKEVEFKTDSNGKPRHKNIWHLTEAGKQWGTVKLDKARTHDKIVEHVRWLPDVLNLIDLSKER